MNYQDILVDLSTERKGEGLRYYLEKDSIAKTYLDKYQENNKPSFEGVGLSTLGAVFILGGYIGGQDRQGFIGKNQSFIMLGGVSLIGLSYLITRTKQISNEKNLHQAINEYNKRNIPKIFFAPAENGQGLSSGVQFNQEF